MKCGKLFTAKNCAPSFPSPPLDALWPHDGQELISFVRMRADYSSAVGTRSQWAKELFPHEGEGGGFGGFGGGGG